MAETRIPGIAAKHCIITETCRANRGDEGAFEEAVARIRDAYHLNLAGRRARGVALPRYRLVLVVEEAPDA